MSQKNQVTRVDSHLIPSTDDAIRSFESHGSHLTVFGPFGRDPLESSSALALQRDAEFHAQYPTFDDIFYGTVNQDYWFFRTGLLFFITLTENFKRLL